MAQKNDIRLPKIGYLYHYPRIDHPTDIFRLDMYITSKPTHQHFDILRLRVGVQTETGTTEVLKITHPWIYKKAARVSAGVLVMEDRKGKKEEALSFGGQLTIENYDEQVFCKLVSTAPIMEINQATPLHMRFIEEIEIIFAENQAKYVNHEDYEIELNKADPIALYLACLDSLLKKYESKQHKTNIQFEFIAYLHTLSRRLEAAGLTRNPIPLISDIFHQ